MKMKFENRLLTWGWGELRGYLKRTPYTKRDWSYQINDIIFKYKKRRERLIQTSITFMLEKSKILFEGEGLIQN